MAQTPFPGQEPHEPLLHGSKRWALAIALPVVSAPPPQPGTPRVSSGGKCFSQGLDAGLTVASLGLEKQLWKVGAAGALLER